MDYCWMVQILKDHQIFPVVFQVFPKNAASEASPSPHKGTCNLITLLIKVSSHRKSSLIFSLHSRVYLWYITKIQPQTHFHDNQDVKTVVAQKMLHPVEHENFLDIGWKKNCQVFRCNHLDKRWHTKIPNGKKYLRITSGFIFHRFSYYGKLGKSWKPEFLKVWPEFLSCLDLSFPLKNLSI